MNDTWYRYLPSRCGYRLAQGPLPPMDSNAPYFLEYLLAANGLFVRSTRPEMEACIPIAPCVVGGRLPPLQPYVRLNGPRVPASLLCEIISHARSAALPNGRNMEQLFFLHLNKGRWTLTVPPQAATALSARATLDAL